MSRAGSIETKRGFTLLEVMIALAILSFGLVALSDLNGGAVQMYAYARRATEATLLLRGKMLDLEELLTKDGFSDFDDEKKGTFEDDGAPDFTWRAEILRPHVQLDASGLLGMLGLGDQKKAGGAAAGQGLSGGLSGALGAAAGLLGGGAGGPTAGLAPGGSLLSGGLAAAGPFAGLIQGQATGFLETIKKSVREVRVTVTWKDGRLERSISASQQVVILPDSVGKAGLNAGPTGPTPAPAAAGRTGTNLGTAGVVSGDGSSK
jgi:general secretion pathway protein I